MTTGEMIARGRKAMGFTQEEFAEMQHVTPQAVSNWERDKNMPDLENLNQIAEIIGIPMYILIGEKDSLMEHDWDVKGVQYSEDRMFTRIKTVAETKGLTQTYKALYFAKSAHRGQYRKKQKFTSVRPHYIVHPLEMTCHLQSMGILEDELLAVSLLHDVCEDCGVKPEELPFSRTVRESVRLLTKPADKTKSKEEINQNYYEAISHDRIASVTKIIDRCNNVSTVAHSFSSEKIDEYITETENYVMPLIKTVKRTWPEYTDLTFLVKYQIVAVIESIKVMMLSGNCG